MATELEIQLAISFVLIILANWFLNYQLLKQLKEQIEEIKEQLEEMK